MRGELEIRLLGGFAVSLDGAPITAFRSAKGRGLLAYLAMTSEQDHNRASLATLLWGDLPQRAARTNLGIELSNLKQRLSNHSALEISRNSVRFHSAAATVDVLDFQNAVTTFAKRSAQSQANHLSELTSAIEQYQGEFLANFYVNGAIGFEDWQIITREQLHDQMMLALEMLQLRYAEGEHWSALAGAARRQLAIVPWAELAHRNLMQALAAQGEIEAALAQYEICRAILHAEIGVEPSLSTIEMAEGLQSGQRAPLVTRHNLGQPLKSFVGRQEEIAQLRDMLPSKRLVTVLGIGGVGKSHLAQAVAQNALHDFADGVWFVPMANVQAGEDAAERIALAIAAAVTFQITNMQAPLAELVAYLVDKEMLLVLDNWEHLIESAETVLYALLGHTTVHILATSRVRLRIEGEIPLHLDGLPPTEACTLFVERARHRVPAFAQDEVDAEIATQVSKVCEDLAGLPLGIELAASWVGQVSVAEIGQSITQIEIEPQQADSLVSRHHKLSQVFEYSWRLLNPRQQHVLAKLTVFRGGFDRIAAAKVAASGLSELSALIGHSLVRRVAAGRYDLHPLIQELAAARLSSEQEVALYQRHSRHFLETLITTERIQRASKLRIDFENIRSAWQHALRAGDEESIGQATQPFGEFMGQFGLMSDAERLFQSAVERFEIQTSQHELVAHLLYQQWIFARTSRGIAIASDLLQRLLSLTSNRELQSKSHIDLANRYAEEGDWAQADHHFDRVEKLLEESSDLPTYISAVESRIHINALQFRGNHAQGITRLQEMQVLLDSAITPISDAENLRTQLLLSLSLLAMRYGAYDLSIRCGRQNLAHITSLNYQQKRCAILLDLALSEQFAGLYEEAIAHNLEALELSEKIGTIDDMGLLQANLCLTMRQSGELEKGLAYGLNAIEILNTLHIPRQEGQARNRVGHTLLALQRWEDAYRAYGDALAVWEPQAHPNRFEAMAGRAAAAFQLDRKEEALGLVDTVLDFVAHEGLVGIVEPILLLLHCESVLNGSGQTKRARQTLRLAENWVATVAGRIDDDAIRHVFLYQRRDHQELNARIVLLD